MKKKRPILIYDTYAIIQLTKDKTTIISIEDIELVKLHAWRYHTTGYAVTKDYTTNKDILLHRMIMNFPFEKEVDHKNKDKLDNRRDNLRIADESGNGCNRGAMRNSKSGIKGVRYRPERKIWIAQINYKKKRYNLGSFKTKEEASQAYEEAAKRLHGEFYYKLN